MRLPAAEHSLNKCSNFFSSRFYLVSQKCLYQIVIKNQTIIVFEGPLFFFKVFFSGFLKDIKPEVRVLQEIYDRLKPRVYENLV